MQRTLVVAMVLGAVGTARAEGVTKAAHAGDSLPMFGVQADLGVPDGASLQLSVRPSHFVRVAAGAAHDGVGGGVSGGVTFVPLDWWFTPTLGVSAGHFFERDANKLARMITGDETFSSPLLDKVGYDFASARIGLEFGRKNFTFYIHGGASVVTATIHNIDAVAAGDSSMPSDSHVTVTTTDPKLRLVGVSASLGFIVYLF